MSALSLSAPLSKPNLYKYNGNEEQTDFNLNLYDFNARFYDPQLGRFTSVDPLADDRNQLDMSPYQYAWNDPVNLGDPTGECPWCIGAVIGSLVDYGTQVAVNLIEGDGLGKALTDIDVGSIVTSAGAGALSGGISSIKQVRNASKLAKAGIGLLTDGTASTANQFATGDGKVSLKDVAIDVTVGQVVGKTAGDVVEQVAKNSPEGTVLRNSADRAQRVADQPKRSQARQASKQRKADRAQNKYDSYGANRAVATAASANSAGSSILKSQTGEKGKKPSGGAIIEGQVKIKAPTGLLGRNLTEIKEKND